MTRAATRNFLARQGVPEGGSLLDYSINQQTFRVAVLPRDNGCYRIQSGSIALDVDRTPTGWAVTGRTADGRVELIADQLGDITTVSGWVGHRTVRLTSSRWEASSERSIRGAVGGENVFLTQHHQVDGNLVSGYVGPKRLSFREREIPGEGPDLEPVVYLAAILPPLECCPPGRVNAVA